MDPDLAITQIAEPQFGAFSRKQAFGAGHSTWMIRHRLETGRWITLHTGVYALAGTPSSWLREQMAACLWSKGPAAGIAAGHLFELPGCEDPPIEVVTTHSNRAMARCGIVVHLTKRLPMEQIGKMQGVPCTTIERTLLDLSGRLSARRAAIALDNALHRRLTTLASLDHCLYLTARSGRNGCGVLRRLLHKRVGVNEVPNSPLETVILDMIIEADLPLPQLQHSIYNEQGRFVARPDFFYEEEGLVIEGHSKLWHEGAYAEEKDAQRDRRLVELGLKTIYLGWADATTHRERTARMLDEILLARRRGIDPLS